MLFTFLYYLSTSLFVVYAFLHLSWLWWKRKYNFLPHAPNVPWLGTVPYLGKTTRHFTLKVIEFAITYDHFYLLWIGPMAAVRIGCAEHAEGLLKGQEPAQKSALYFATVLYLKDGLIMSKGKKWKGRRSALTPAFHFSILKDFVETFDEHAKRLVEELKKKVQCSEGIVEVQELTSLCTLDVICETSMGVRMNALGDSESENVDFVRNVQKFKELMLLRTLDPFLLSDFIYKLTKNGQEFYKCVEELNNYAVDVINERIRMRRETHVCDDGGSRGRKKRVLVDTLLDLYEEG